MQKPSNTTVSISFNAHADMSGGDVNLLFLKMFEYEKSQRRGLHFAAKSDASGTQVTFNLTGEFTKAHEKILADNGVQRWQQEVTVEGYRQRVRKAVIDFLKRPFS